MITPGHLLGQSGMGAVVTAAGVIFRVWAPHTSKVFVTGSFNNWAEDATPLHKEENGYWSADVARHEVVAQHANAIENRRDVGREASAAANAELVQPGPDMERVRRCDQCL